MYQKETGKNTLQKKILHTLQIEVNLPQTNASKKEGNNIPSLYLMTRSTSTGYLVMRWVMRRILSEIPNRRMMDSWHIF